MFEDVDAGREVSRYLGLSLREVPAPGGDGPSAVEGTVPVAPELRTREGGLATGAVLAVVDAAGGLAGGLAALPDWVVSTNLSVRVTRLAHVGPLVVRASILRAGRTAIVVGADVVDRGDGDRIVAAGQVTSAILTPAGGPPDYPRPIVLDGPAPPVDEDPAGFFRLAPGDEPGSVALDLVPHLRNPWGILHGGALTVLLDAAVRRAVAGHAEAAHGPGGPRVPADSIVHFLSPGRVGPIVAVAAVAGVRPDGAVVRVEVRDRGADGRLVALAVVTARDGGGQREGGG